MKINLKFNGAKEKAADGSRPASTWNLDLQLEMSPEEFIQSGKYMVEGVKMAVDAADHIIDREECSKMRLLEHEYHLKKMMRCEAKKEKEQE